MLYAASIEEMARPVKGGKTLPSPPASDSSLPNEKIKKPRAPRKPRAPKERDNKKEEETQPEPVDQPAEDPVSADSRPEQTDQETPKPAGQRKRKASKIDQIIEEKQSEIDAVAAKVKTLEDKIEAKKAAKEAKKAEKARQRAELEPPKWFTSYIQNMKHDENSFRQEKRPRKEIVEEAKVDAKEHWGNDHTRTVAQYEANRHLNQMQSLYRQIFRR